MSFENSQVAISTAVDRPSRSLPGPPPRLNPARCIPADTPLTGPDVPKFYGANEAQMPQSFPCRTLHLPVDRRYARGAYAATRKTVFAGYPYFCVLAGRGFPSGPVAFRQFGGHSSSSSSPPFGGPIFWALATFLRTSAGVATQVNRHSPDELWNGVDASRRRGSPEATGGLRSAPGVSIVPGVPNDV